VSGAGVGVRDQVEAGAQPQLLGLKLVRPCT